MTQCSIGTDWLHEEAEEQEEEEEEEGGGGRNKEGRRGPSKARGSEDQVLRSILLKKHRIIACHS